VSDHGTNELRCKPGGLRFAAHTDHNELVLAVLGEADAGEAPILGKALEHASSNGHTRVTIDLANLSFIDTRCLSLIFATHERLEARGVDFVLRAPQPPVRRLLNILKRHDLLEGSSARAVATAPARPVASSRAR
jgi:anti-anti-sigma factor